jgi:hypothetical protein
VVVDLRVPDAGDDRPRCEDPPVVATQAHGNHRAEVAMEELDGTTGTRVPDAGVGVLTARHDVAAVVAERDRQNRLLMPAQNVEAPQRRDVPELRGAVIER